jgi:hypothetical protein
MLATGCLCCAICLPAWDGRSNREFWKLMQGRATTCSKFTHRMHGSKDVESDEVLAKVAAAQSPVRVFRASVESRTGLSSTIAISCRRTQTPAFIDPDDLSFAQGRVGDSCHSISPRDSRSPQQRNSSLVSRQEIGVCSWMNVRVTTTETLHGVSQGSSDSRSRQR